VQRRQHARFFFVEAEPLEPLLTALVHVLAERDDGTVTASNALGVEATCAEDDERIEDLGR